MSTLPGGGRGPGGGYGAPGGGPGGPGGRGGRGGRDGRGGRGDRGRGREEERSPYEEKVVAINRVAKVVKGGRRFSFTALVVVGDANGTVGVGYGKAKEVPAAIQRASRWPRRTSSRSRCIQKHDRAPGDRPPGSGQVVLKPAAPGTGVIAGGAVRAVLECAGISDVLAKSLGTSNPINVVHATVAALRQLRRPEDIARLRGLELEEIMPKKMLDNFRIGARDG